MAKRTMLNQQIWRRHDERLFCHTCNAWVKPIEKDEIKKCPNCKGSVVKK